MSLILFEQQGPLGILTLNSPANLNAMTVAMGKALEEEIGKIKERHDLRVLIVKGAGRAFSAGGDLDFILDHTTKSPETNRQEMLEFYGRFLKLREIEIPTIALLHGPAIGAGFLIALACDLRYAVPDAKLATNFSKLGLSSGMGGLYWLTRLAGPARAADLLFTGRTLEAQEAQTMGLINQCFSTDTLEAKVKAIAEQIAANAPAAIKIMKQGLQQAPLWDLRQVCEYEAQGQAQCFGSQDLLSGIQAVKEKKPPIFQGH